MKRLLLATTMMFAIALLSASAWADAIIYLVSNDGAGDNFGALVRNGADFIKIRGGTPGLSTFQGYPPGSTFGWGGPGSLFIDPFGEAYIGGHGYTTQQAYGADASLTIPTVTLPTIGQSFRVPVEVSFFAPLMLIETGERLDVSGSTDGYISFSYNQDTGLDYFVGFQTPEPSTFGLMVAGLTGVLASSRKRLGR
jgi:hypothetical protein